VHRCAQVLVLVVTLGMGSPANTWNKAGHMVSGAIAYRDLKARHPDVIPKVIALLRQHPDFERRWKPRLESVPEEERDLYLFMLAARWPDDARGTSFDRPSHHFIDQPFVPPGQPASVNVSQPDAVNLVSTFKQNVDIAKGTGGADDRAVALCWIFHQVGDVHQPLHDVSLFSTDYVPPEGDRGGTRFYIRVRDDSSTISLHKFWDDLILGSERFRTVRNRATELSARPEMARATFPELSEPDIEKWAKEGFAIAAEFVYRQGDLVGSKDKNDGESLPEDYVPEVKPIAERRIMLSGYRLADTLLGLFP
jgi:hypothetical protein